MSYQYPPPGQEAADRFADGKYLLRTWTGRLILMCGIIYVPMALLTGSILSTNSSFFNLLYLLGAKETASLSQGEWWRLVNPVFLHFNLIHFLLNMAALKFIGRIVERHVGSLWFLSIFFLSGIQGNLWSALSNTALGAGASGAIFGLIGTMILIEYAAEWKRVKESRRIRISGDIIDISDEGTKKFRPIPGPFTVMGLLNIALAVGINTIASFSETASFGIDNAAHMGGLVTGLLFGLAFLLIRPTSLLPRKIWLGQALAGLVILAMAAQTAFLSESPHLKNLLLEEARREINPQKSLYLFERALKTSPDDPGIHFQIGRLLVLGGNPRDARKYLRYAAQSRDLDSSFKILEDQLLSENNLVLFEWIKVLRAEARGTPL